MHEQEKLTEARYFLGRMRAVHNQPTEYRHELSAFLTANRSVLQYARRELEGSSSCLSWYDGVVRSDQVIRFLREKRNLSVHEEPLTLANDVTVKLGSEIGPTGMLKVAKRAEGNREFVDVLVTGRELPSAARNVPAQISYRYRFEDWTDPDSATELCERYLAVVEGLVAEAQRRGCISG